ncbi:hypothetical protein F5Y12DRAFT_91320 [Xylaria sp. FL1777]|nr:hypothetical protein F5Y12DRAFT_91320 [Xylaria sp. FL1777]
MAEVAAATLSGLSRPLNENRRKSSKPENTTSSNKRPLDTKHAEQAQRKHKRSKSSAAPMPSLAPEVVESGPASKQKRKSHKSGEAKESHVEQDLLQDKPGGDGVDDGGKRSKRRKIDRKEDKKKKKKSKSRESQDRALDEDNGDDAISSAHQHSGVVVLDSSHSTKVSGAGKLSKHQYPFYTQTISQYLPLHPLGINEPIQGYLNQHLEPLLNRYVPSFGGVLLSYRSPRIGEAPGEGLLTQDSGIEDMVMLESVNEHAVSFGWLTVDIDIFRPSRGAWLEGLINIQSGGHIGVVCWGKFNASIESERLPRNWRWIDQHASKEVEEAEPKTTSPSPSAQDIVETDHTDADHTEVHATGYWVDGQGSKITADTPICFRVKNYEVGTSGDYGYLSIEGTMLTEEEESKIAQKEREIQKRKRSRGVLSHRDRRPLLELGMTKFANDNGGEPKTGALELSY